MQWLINIIKEWCIAQGYATMAWVRDQAYATRAWVQAQGYALQSWVRANFFTQAQVLEWITPVNVSGELSPDATCTYFYAGEYNDSPYYRRADGEWFIWYNPEELEWMISTQVGVAGDYCWIRHDPVITGQYSPSPAAEGVATVAEGRKYLCTSFVDRGDPASWDFSTGDFITDGAWHELDLSAIVPAGAKAVSLRLKVTDELTVIGAKFRKAGNSNSLNIFDIITGVSNYAIVEHGCVALDENRKVEYNFFNTTWTEIYVIVKGWWL